MTVDEKYLIISIDLAWQEGKQEILYSGLEKSPTEWRKRSEAEEIAKKRGQSYTRTTIYESQGNIFVRKIHITEKGMDQSSDIELTPEDQKGLLRILQEAGEKSK